jgi:hypothetical protein
MFEIPFSELPQSLKIEMQHDPAFLRPHFLEIRCRAHTNRVTSPPKGGSSMRNAVKLEFGSNI